VIAHFVDIGGIVDYQCLSFFHNLVKIPKKIAKLISLSFFSMISYIDITEILLKVPLNTITLNPVQY